MAGTITASIVKNDTTSPPQFQNSAGTEIGTLCRAWVNFNGSTGSIRASFNVSSVTRSGTGDYTLNFTSAFADTNFSMVATATNNSSAYGAYVLDNTPSTARTTTTIRILTVAYNALQDSSVVNVAVFR